MYIEPIQKNIVLPLEKGLNALFTQRYNPFYYHGALPNLFLWVLFLTGLLLLVYYQATLETAYPSMKFITYEAPFGNAMRSLHRYAADGMMIFVLIHLFRVWFTDRFREYRIIPWLSGVILLAVLFIVGLTGYMLIWDQDAVALTNMTFSGIHSLPFIGPALASFLMGTWISGKEIMTDYTVTSILVFHVGLPLLMMFLLWWHYLRITRPVTDPPVALMIMLLGGLLLFAGAYPVVLSDQAPADLSIVSGTLDFDILFTFPQYMVAALGWDVAVAWLFVLGIPVLLLALPYLQKKAMRGQYAHVVFENCTGGSLCYNDCPYEAITMVAREKNDGTRFKRMATVDPGRCANCGLCVGACAFKAIDIPRCESVDVLKEIELSLNTSS